ncbi:MAG TPA: RNB domain-containing ribonuclease [Vicinamibacterales bacterium]|jgi:exoribonuclease-2
MSSRRFLQEIAHEAMRERGFEPDFSQAAQAQVARLDGPAAPDARRDLRQLLWCSIDNDDSRDLDQLSVAETTPSGATRILVAIADVDSLVQRDTPVDQHAAHNTTSVYTGAQTFPMLPERLSTDLTSLNENDDRNAIVIAYVVDADGSIGDSEVSAAVVRNHAKLAYPSVGAWLEGNAPPPPALADVPGLDANLRQQDRAAQALKKRRHQMGALTLTTIEARPVFDEDTLRDLAETPHTRASELIEDFMIASNGVVARFLADHGLASLRRVVRVPQKWTRIVDLAAEHGSRLPEHPDAVALEEWLLRRRAEDPQHFPDLSLAVVKLLGRGEYIVEHAGEDATGHFGLAVQDYTHSTAPNRRFPDLVAQRIVKAALNPNPPNPPPAPYSDAALQAIAERCTEREDAANKVERLVRKAAAALLLQSRIGERFDAIVTGASEKGTWVRIRKPPVEGRLERGHEGLDVGDHVRVKLVHTDPARGFIDFARS